MGYIFRNNNLFYIYIIIIPWLIHLIKPFEHFYLVSFIYSGCVFFIFFLLIYLNVRGAGEKSPYSNFSKPPRMRSVKKAGPDAIAVNTEDI